MQGKHNIFDQKDVKNVKTSSFSPFPESTSPLFYRLDYKFLIQSGLQIPRMFWQFVPPVSTIDRIKRDIQKVVDVYEKGALLENKTVHVNARIGKEELVQELKKRGFRFVTKRKDNVEELWDLSDGINSPCEEIVQNIVEQIGVKQYQTQCKNALYLNMGDLKLVTNNIPGLVFHSFKKK